MHRTCGLTSPQLRGRENEPLPRRGFTHVRRGSPTPPERPTEGLHFGIRPSRGEHQKTCGRATGGVRRPLLLTSQFFGFRRSGSQCAVHGPVGSIMFPRYMRAAFFVERTRTATFLPF